MENACITVARAPEPEDISGKVLPTPCQRMISVNFMKEGGDPFTLTLDPSKPLKCIGKSVEAKTGIPVEHQTFIMPRKAVDPEKAPDSLNLVEGDSVYLSDSRDQEPNPRTEGSSGG
ncbi:hypothetical protein ECG_02324 [Echinococcus granulosus]|uniref:Ubiquitin-like domain-containing protein n=1 Tax=Echinococcus granulosus TaxID=6210 RepID=W6U599_ECHGR|nr:hypothetical protein EGR_08850 [Echinococcus granulosus]EUB56305.1 hypothetical protein EGR_08850 [Echinococcus granulosus]KAH9284669.1 hypothetical protein ECG_02324 [Echinococcus granulosus]